MLNNQETWVTWRKRKGYDETSLWGKAFIQLYKMFSISLVGEQPHSWEEMRRIERNCFLSRSILLSDLRFYLRALCWAWFCEHFVVHSAWKVNCWFMCMWMSKGQNYHSFLVDRLVQRKKGYNRVINWSTFFLQMLECLKDNREQLSDQCRETVFKREASSC